MQGGGRRRYVKQRHFLRTIFRVSTVWRQLLCVTVNSDYVLLLAIRTPLPSVGLTRTSEANWDQILCRLCITIIIIKILTNTLSIQCIRMLGPVSR